MKIIKLNNEISIDLEKLVDTRLLVQANSGAGKSWAIRRILEQSHGKIQQIVIDPEGEFGTLREKYDYILAGKGGDTSATPASASLLAKKLLELNVSAIIDLYELSPQDRKKFVRYFIDSMVNAPKELWHPVMVVVDEAHIFVPEKGESEASGAVIDLCTRGRKRGYCAVLATQRISKLHKDAAAECNNKLIGRAGLDIDRKRASEELGFTTKDQNISLRSLEAGEFYAFGPAISNEVIKLQIGDIQTSHPKAGSRSLVEVAPPTDKIKKILGKLADLPAEARKEAETVDSLKKMISELKRSLSAQKTGISSQDQQKNVEKAVEKATSDRDKAWGKVVDNWKSFVGKMVSAIEIFKTLDISKFPDERPLQPTTFRNITADSRPEPLEKSLERHINNIRDEVLGEKKFGACSKAIYSYLAQNDSRFSEYTKTQVAVAVGYSRNSSSFNNSLSELSGAGLIERGPRGLKAIASRYRDDLVVLIDKSLEKWSSKLGVCSRKIWELLIDPNHNPEHEYSKEEISDKTGYSVNSSSFNNSLSQLSGLGLIERVPGGMVRINPEILNL